MPPVADAWRHGPQEFCPIVILIQKPLHVDQRLAGVGQESKNRHVQVEREVLLLQHFRPQHMEEMLDAGDRLAQRDRCGEFAGGKEVPLMDPTHNLRLNEVDLARPNKPEMTGPKTAHEEVVMMRKLYNEMILKQQEIKTEDNGDKPVQIQGLSRKKDLAVASV